MIDLFSVGFEFRNSSYSFLARVKEKDDVTEYHITVMNGDLEKLLYGNHVLVEKHGEILLEHGDDNEQSLLKTQIALALSRHLDYERLHASLVEH